MQTRAGKVRRAAGVQAQIKRLEEWRLDDLERQLAAAEAAERELICALNADHPMYGLFIDAMARRLQALGEEAGRLRDARHVQARRLLRSAGRLKTAERLAAAVDRDALRETSRKELLDLIEALAAGDDASLP